MLGAAIITSMTMMEAHMISYGIICIWFKVPDINVKLNLKNSACCSFKTCCWKYCKQNTLLKVLHCNRPSHALLRNLIQVLPQDWWSSTVPNASMTNFHDGMCRNILKDFEIRIYIILYIVCICISHNHRIDACIYSIEIIFMLHYRLSYYPQPPSCPVSELFRSQALPKQSTRDLAPLLPGWLEVHLTTAQELHGGVTYNI